MNEREMKRNERINKRYLFEFKKYLKKTGLENSKIENIIMDADFYVNAVMLFRLKKTAVEGAEPMNVESFFGSIFLDEFFCPDEMEMSSVIDHVRYFYTFLTRIGVLPYSHYKEFIKCIEDGEFFWTMQASSSFDDFDLFI